MLLSIDPKVDFAFKHLFGRESTRPLLIDLVNQVLDQPPGRRIQEIELLNPFNPKEAAGDKLSILDVKVRDQSGRQFNVEMQMFSNAYFRNRIAYYLAKFHQQQLHEGEDYSALKPTIAIVFVNEPLFPDVPDYHLRFRLLDEQHKIPFADDLEIHTLELPKFNKTEAELTTGLDLWLYFLRNAETIDPEALPQPLKQPLLRSAIKELIVLSQTDIERELYESRRKAQLDYNTGIKCARNEGKAEGLAEGLTKGLAEGLTKGDKIGAIHLCQQVLHRPQSPTEQLAQLSLEELTRMAEELRAELLSRG